MRTLKECELQKENHELRNQLGASNMRLATLQIKFDALELENKRYRARFKALERPCPSHTHIKLAPDEGCAICENST